MNLLILYSLLFSGEKVTLFQGKTAGRIALKPQGPLNFGWDPIFIPTIQTNNNINNLSYAQMNKEEKNRISHRAKALEKLKGHFLG